MRAGGQASITRKRERDTRKKRYDDETRREPVRAQSTEIQDIATKEKTASKHVNHFTRARR